MMQISIIIFKTHIQLGQQNMKPTLSLNQQNSLSKRFKPKIQQLNNKYIVGFLEASDKFLKLRNSNSLPASLHLNKSRLNKIYSIYRTNTPQKILKSHSNNSSKILTKTLQNNSKLLKAGSSSLKINSQIMNLGASNLPTNKKTHKLKLDSTIYNGNSDINIFIQKLEKLHSTILDKVFLAMYEQLCHQLEKNQTQNDLFYKAFKLINQCNKRSAFIVQNQYNRKILKLRQLNESIQSQLIKSQTKISTLNSNLDKYSQINKDLNIQLTNLKNKLLNMVDIGVNTQHTHHNHNKYIQTQIFMSSKQLQQQSNDLHISDKKLAKKLKHHEKKQKQLISVLCLLKKQGVNIESAYRKIIQSQLKNTQSSNDDSTIILHSMFTKKKEKKIEISNQFQYDADESYISSIKAFSFNYEDKEQEPDIFQSRYQFKQSKQIDQKLKNILKLNLKDLKQQAQKQQLNNKSVATM